MDRPAIHAATALRRNEPAKGVELLTSASPYERSYLTPAYLRGLTYLRLHKGAEAVAEFRKIADHKGANWGATRIHPYWGQFYSLSHLGMARAMCSQAPPLTPRRPFRTFLDCGRTPTARSLY